MNITELDLCVLTWHDDHDLLLSEEQVTEDHTHTHTEKVLEGHTECYQCLVTSEE